MFIIYCFLQEADVTSGTIFPIQPKKYSFQQYVFALFKNTFNW